jgi:hypothetical protein
VIWIVYLIGTLAGSALLGPPRAWSGVDPTVNRDHYSSEAIAYRSWTSSPDATTFRKTGKCVVTVFALATREKLTRLRVNGNELEVDWSWSWDAEIPEGHHASGMFIEFLDPVGGAVLAKHEVMTLCPWRSEEGYR